MNGYYKAELIRGPARTAPWKTVEEVELATLGWVHWHNTQRLHGYLGDIPPVEFEATNAAGGDLNPSDQGDPQVTDSAARAADRLPAPHPEPADRQTMPNPAPPALTRQPASTPARPPWPPAPPGSATIMCGNPGSAVQRTPRYPKRT